MNDKGKSISRNNHRHFHELLSFKSVEQFETVISSEIGIFIQEEPVKIDLTVDEFNSVSVR